MTRSPLSATLIPLVPLAALGWPLAKVINREPYQQQVEVEEVNVGPLIQADLQITAAHPFERLEVTAGDATWTFNANEDIKEIYFPKEDDVILTVTAIWPEDTPESAILLTLRPDGRLDRTDTLWGYLAVTKEIKFTWDPEP
ncbi:hypothetical protein N9205_00675 [Akkermansiaceae bacterium]|nr:hypothetical protein [Akkermansiaceae bacterium]